LGGGYFGEDTNAPLVDGWVIDEASRPSGLGLTIHKAFGHGLLQVAPRLDALMQHDSTMDVLVPDFAWDDSALLARVGVDARRVRRVSRNNRHHLVRVPELIVSTHLHPEQYTARADPKWQAEFVSRFVGETTVTPSRRVHFARRDTSGERGGCVNRQVLNDLAAEFGYEEIFPELLTFDEQVELVASTVDVFGERGSALNWSLFMPSGSRTVLVNSKAMNRKDSHVTFHNPVLAARGSQYREINAVRAGTPNFFEVDPRSVRRALESMS
jgi:capsular polysaccharide biosynthesis protein